MGVWYGRLPIIPKYIIIQITLKTDGPIKKFTGGGPFNTRRTFFFLKLFKDPLNCETGMRGTVMCRPTVAWLQDITQTRHWLNALLMLDQCPRRWPNIDPRVHNVWGKAVLSIRILGVSCFAIPAVTRSVRLQTQRPAKSLDWELWVLEELLIHGCRLSIYGLAMIWELALNAVVIWNTYFSIIMI